MVIYLVWYLAISHEAQMFSAWIQARATGTLLSLTFLTPVAKFPVLKSSLLRQQQQQLPFTEILYTARTSHLKSQAGRPTRHLELVGISQAWLLEPLPGGHGGHGAVRCTPKRVVAALGQLLQPKAGSGDEHWPQSTYLYLVAWVATVTEKPRIPEVFLQVGYTW